MCGNEAIVTALSSSERLFLSKSSLLMFLYFIDTSPRERKWVFLFFI